MAGLMGLGDCGVCGMHIAEGVPVRNFKGHIMAHKDCFKEYSADDKRLSRAREAVDRLNAQIGAMTFDRDANLKIIEDLEGAVNQ